jgi:WD40 repeat protein
VPIATGKTRFVALSRDGSTFAVAGDRSVCIYDGATGQELLVTDPNQRGNSSLALSPDGRTLAAGDNEGHVRIWDVTQRRQRAELRAHDGCVSTLSFSDDGAMLVSASFADSVPRVWDALTGRAVVALRGHTTAVQTATFCPDGRTLATATMHGDLRLWNIATGQQLAVLHGNDNNIFAIAFSPDGQTVAAGGVGAAIWIWDLKETEQETHA